VAADTDEAARAGAAGWDRSAAEYERVLDANRVGAERLVAALPDAEYPRVLDVGCGTGFASRAMIRAAGAREVTGIDVSAEMVERYRERLAGEGAAVRAHVADVLEMPVPEGAFDAVITTMAYHWFPDKPGAVRAMAAALRPGGVLALLASGRGSDHEYREVLRGISPPVPARLIEVYDELQRSPGELEEDLVAAGLEPLDVWTETRERHLPPEGFLARKEATENPLLEGLADPERAALRARISAAVRAASGPRGFAYTFVKLNAVARRP
jgi:SAM-dependent methyltransferase